MANGDDLIVENGGTLVYGIASTPPTFNASATMRINNGGVLSARVSGITAAGAGVNASTVIYDDGSILEWNLVGGTPSASGVTFFPNANAATVPILRFATSVPSAGGGGTTIVNGKLELATGVTLGFTGAGTKTFRNGVRGAGTLTQGTAGQFIINGTTAELGGGTLTLGANGLAINSGTTATLSSNKTIGGTGTTTISGIVNLNGFTLTAGAIAGTGTLSGSATSSLVVNASGTLRFTTGAQTLKDLTVNTGTATLATALDITAGAALNTSGTVTVATGAVLASAGNLTIKSNEFGTARVAAGPNTQYITGDVTVERYIPNNGSRAWRLLSVPTAGVQTIKASWQEGNAALGNSKPNYGTQITGPGGSGVGFDNTASSPSILSWGGTAWSNVTGTLGAISADPNKAYFLFVRGERTKGIAGTNSNTSATTLETKGTIYTGEQTRTISTPNSFGLIPNLYPSAINFTTLTRTNVNDAFYIWDSKLSTNGAYQVFSGTNYYASTTGGSYGTAGVTPNTTIESGQAFLVRTDATPGGGSIVLHESSKIGGTNGSLGFRPSNPALLVKMDTRLHSLSGSIDRIVDGNAVVFDNVYSEAVDSHDALKLSNPGENFAVAIADKNLAVEGRPAVSAEDVIAYKMWNMHQQTYQLELIPSNLGGNGLVAELEDKYLRTSTPVSLETNSQVTFTVDANAASFAADRFRLVFRQGAPLPVSFTSISASRMAAAIQVDWKVAAERGMRSYEVQRSTDGRNFTTAGSITATGAASYRFADAGAPACTVFYRVKGIGAAGEIKYTSIVKVMTGEAEPGLAISPNPAEGSIVNLQFMNRAKGRYTVTLLGTNGQAVFTSLVAHAGGNSTQVLNLPEGIAKGIYQVEVIAPDNSKTTQKLVINN